MICIIDDDAFVRSATESLLQSLGFEVFAFESADAFLDSGRVNGTSCLITDVRMPGLSGLGLQKRLVADGTPLPVIFITAFATEQMRKQAMEGGAVGFLLKPFSESALIDCIDMALKWWRQPLMKSGTAGSR
jgi:FixJ family two-component response regulator